MKIEKITENKIRIILKQEDFKDKSINIEKLLLNTPNSCSLFLEILDKAKKEIDFDTDGQKLFIEMSLKTEDAFIFTITKYSEPQTPLNNIQKKYLTIKKKNGLSNSSCYIYQFNIFENFCAFCDFMYNDLHIENVFKNSVLFFYNDIYYLVVNNIDKSNKELNSLHSSLLEFSDSFSFSKNLYLKLKEYGKVIIKSNAISTGIKYFSTKN